VAEYPFTLVNVFTFSHQPFSGNPLCVFEKAIGLSSLEMQALARQFNLSETTFVFPPSSHAATAQVRIFAPSFEMPFAGHPTLGTAEVVGKRQPRVVLEMGVGLIDVTRDQEEWSLRVPQEPSWREVEASRGELAEMLGLGECAVLDSARWIDTGIEQMIIPLAHRDDVRNARPQSSLLARHARSSKHTQSMVYAWAQDGQEEILARFFLVSPTGVVESPATGSACANLGGWMLAMSKKLPLHLRIYQGESVSAPLVNSAAGRCRPVHTRRGSGPRARSR
jgi:PhzF family phenazine biosynthesis protein